MRINGALSYICGALLGLAGLTLPAAAQPAWTTSGSNLVTNAATADVDVANNLFWGNNATLSTAQGGSLELGAANGATGTGIPFIDFHYNGLAQDYNVRMINDADGRLSLAATTFYTWANVGLGATSPLARLHVQNGSVLASGTSGNTPTSGAGTRMMWIPAKNSFRAGTVNGTQWDSTNIGSGSFAIGSNTKASGIYSFAGGNGSTATYDYGFAYGNGAYAANRYAMAIGQNTRADGWYSFAGGYQSAANGQYSDYTFVFGKNDTADQWYAVAFGENNRSFGYGSFTAGSSNYVDNSYGVAMGSYDTVRGSNGVAMGYSNTVNGDYGTAFGAFNIVGGTYAHAINANNVSSAWYSNASGFGNTASGDESSAAGLYTTASGATSATFGDHTTASGTGSFAIGSYTTASGQYSLAMGNHTTAQAYKSLVMGRYNVISGTTNSWVSSEPAFVIGNGSSSLSASNALTTYKNGNMTIAGTLTENSDSRLKQELAPIDGVLEKIERIQPVTYSFIDQERHPAGRQLGFVAQEIEKTFPELVTTDQSGYLAVSYSHMSAVAIQAVKEQQRTIQQLQAEKGDLAAQLAAANNRLDDQARRLARLEAMVSQLTGTPCCTDAPSGAGLK